MWSRRCPATNWFSIYFGSVINACSALISSYMSLNGCYRLSSRSPSRQCHSPGTSSDSVEMKTERGASEEVGWFRSPSILDVVEAEKSVVVRLFFVITSSCKTTSSDIRCPKTGPTNLFMPYRCVRATVAPTPFEVLFLCRDNEYAYACNGALSLTIKESRRNRSTKIAINIQLNSKPCSFSIGEPL